ncbi:anthranilate phosphoribosyltransferase [Frateuria aurantia]
MNEVHITPRAALQRVIEHREIFQDEMVSLMHQIMLGEVSPVMVAALIAGLRVKKESIGEITGAALVMRELAAKVPLPDAGADGRSIREHMVDIVGTGGDGAGTFNISTASMFVAAAAGACVAKHGGRSVSSTSGSADVLQALGAEIDLGPGQVAQSMLRTGIGFMYAPNHHPAMKVVAPVRRELGVRSLFNILGPLTNPADAPAILHGVFHPDLVGIQSRVLQALGAKRAMVVWGTDGLDEISIGARTLVGELKDGRIREFEIAPTDFGIDLGSMDQLRVASAEESMTMLQAALGNQPGPARDIVCLNAGAAIYVAGRADSMLEGVALAQKVIADGSAHAKMRSFVSTTRELAGGTAS